MARQNHRLTPLQRAAAATAVATVQGWRWLRPHLVRGPRLLDRGRRAMGRWVDGHRPIVAGLGVRLAWWTALALLIWGGLALVSLGVGSEELPGQLALRAFAAGAALCAIGVVLAPSRSLRWLSSAQGLMHAWCAIVAWIALGG